MQLKQIIGKFAKKPGTNNESALKIREKSENRFASLGIVLLVLLLGIFIIIGVIFARYESERYAKQEFDNVQRELDEMRTSLTNRIYSNIYKVSAVKALVAMNPDLTQDDFARAMEVQFRGEHDLRNIGLARDMVLQFMYPIEGNEAAPSLHCSFIPLGRWKGQDMKILP